MFWSSVTFWSKWQRNDVVLNNVNMMYPHLIDIALLYAINTKQATSYKIPCNIIVVHCNPLNVNKGNKYSSGCETQFLCLTRQAQIVLVASLLANNSFRQSTFGFYFVISSNSGTGKLDISNFEIFHKFWTSQRR